MSNILSKEDKIYLGRICRYLSSIGMQDGIVEIDEINSDVDDIDWENITHFSNNYSADIPPGLTPIFQKIWKYVQDEDLLNRVDDEYDINWERIEIKISCESGEISASYDYGYYAPGDSSGTEWEYDENDDDNEMIDELFKSLDETTPDSEGNLYLDYNGSGDSGYIESNFNNRDSVPTEVEDWCYRQLENLHGGWEINEGSQGTFRFNVNDKFIELSHQYNIDETGYDTLWEEKF